MIELVAKNKILDYITLSPEAEIPLLIWIAESHINRSLTPIVKEEQQLFCQLGASKYSVDVRINPFLRVAYIKWLGTTDEFPSMGFAEIKALQTDGSDPNIEKAISTEVTFSTPSPMSFSDIPLTIPDPLLSFKKKEVSQPFDEISSGKANYEKAVYRVLEIFDSRPGTSTFDELARLIQLIKAYEAQYIKLPELNLSDAIKCRMEEFKLKAEDLLPHSVASKDEIELFLAGLQSLPERQLHFLLKRLGFRFTG